jgi:hypothetical protein
MYKLEFQNSNMSCEVKVTEGDGEVGLATKAAEEDTLDKGGLSDGSAKEAKDYLESHQVLQFVQAVLQTVIKERPANPYLYMGKHFMSGYASEQKSVPTSPSAEVEAKAKEEAAKPTEEAKTDEPEKPVRLWRPLWWRRMRNPQMR